MKKFGLTTAAWSGAIALAVLAGAPIAQAKGGLPSCSTTISSCGCAITSPGNYEVSQALTGTTGVDCIDIKAKNVNLNTEGYDIAGPGAVGINVLKSAKNANVQFGPSANASIYTTISGFSTGMQVAAPYNTVWNCELDDNSGDGLVYTKSANSSRMADCGMYENGGNGITINGASYLVLDDFGSTSNAGIGIEINGGKNPHVGDFTTDNNGTGGISATKTNNSVFEDFDADLIQSGNGITLTKTKGDTMVAFTTWGDSQNGVEISSSNVDTVQDFESYLNTLSGVLVTGSKNINVVDAQADENGVYGVQLQNTSKSLLNYIWDATGDAIAGVYVGCETTAGPAGTACADIGPSNSNVLNGIYAGYDSADSASEDYGVAVDYKDSNNLITGVYAAGSTDYDAIDQNSACDSNVWFNIAADTATPSCIPAVPPMTRTTKQGVQHSHTPGANVH